ncbi:peptidoglycan/xylan/chitin deacetylase (PgdA/CDA1 family) [Streptomyces sp. SAI-208]|uniref:polysaccharide deacetylase family protein n=1 Tax=unclassified Streptomyces TaxID=2593676 RepID=UPI0024753CFB|nr:MULTISPECIES: polysaccharide deacetylase family protein [unclassified Streptomyces]MDH6520154.1 peptidoglycan/xylan/chitin deacetylase (PgdA/CDA1 family) [Streptomyces sp. SAI-090]MDH6552370.1 peptidoglycan/xylan/chitin deacetylase (PgdA/CDA1 family) [Streptomyces sp. SAI-041]MDH6611134.1 peptidoglycan/xylan/chitin deacetylase (PgdA/CDA1 family) [Streptomyces sp. SAI-208]MDH6615755.1 peptidoglycan/xylan/chitin deacetylase (PgdA/CDA1 family) [Streptomyces sp. SAI-135]
MAEPPVPILMYHSVATDPNDATRTLSVSPAAFAQQMQLVAELGLTPIRTADLAARWRTGRPLPARPLLITFDDGYEGVHRHALPVLVKHGFPATVFVSTGWIRGAHDTGGGLDTMLDWDQVRELAAADVEIGGHTHTHPQLDQLDDTALRHELIHSREIVTDEVGTAPVSLAYPYGYSSRRVREAVRETGYGQALAVNNALARRRQGPYALTRLTVRRATTAEEFERLVQGRAITRAFARDRALTKGYALVRRARQVRRKVSRSRV